MAVRRPLTVALLASLLGGCLATGGGAPSLVVPTSTDDPASARARAEARSAADLNAARVTWSLVNNATLDTYLNGLLERVRSTAPGGPPARIHVIPLPAATAETTAAGNIYLSVGWLRSARSEDELIALIAHEYGHVLKGHHGSDLVGDMGSLGRSAYLLKTIAAKSTAGLGSDIALGLWNDAAHPVWKREQERQADAFALDATMALRLSYGDGIKAFLERVREWDSRVDAASGGKPGLFDAMKDSHPNADERLADIQRLLAEKYPERVRAKARRAEWQAILDKPDVKALLARHKNIVQAKELLAAGNAAQAIKLASAAASGDGLQQGWIASTLGDALVRGGQIPQGMAVLQQATVASEPNPQAAALLAALQLAANRPLDARATIEQSFERLGKPEVMYPVVIGTYRAVIDRLPQNSLEGTQVQLAKTLLTAECVTFPAYKDPCIYAGMTPAERTAQEARQQARQQKLEQGTTKAVGKLFGK